MYRWKSFLQLFYMLIYLNCFVSLEPHSNVLLCQCAYWTLIKTGNRNLHLITMELRSCVSIFLVGYSCKSEHKITHSFIHFQLICQQCLAQTLRSSLLLHREHSISKKNMLSSSLFLCWTYGIIVKTSVVQADTHNLSFFCLFFNKTHQRVMICLTEILVNWSPVIKYKWPSEKRGLALSVKDIKMAVGGSMRGYSVNNVVPHYSYEQAFIFYLRRISNVFPETFKKPCSCFIPAVDHRYSRHHLTDT